MFTLEHNNIINSNQLLSSSTDSLFRPENRTENSKSISHRRTESQPSISVVAVKEIKQERSNEIDNKQMTVTSQAPNDSIPIAKKEVSLGYFRGTYYLNKKITTNDYNSNFLINLFTQMDSFGHILLSIVFSFIVGYFNFSFLWIIGKIYS